jgi:hypothetical protein
MNFSRVIAAAVVATLVDAVYGFLVYGMVLSSQFARYPLVYRPNDVQGGYLPLMFLGILIAMIAVSAIYAKGYEAKGPGPLEGMRFGVFFGIFAAAFYCSVNYATLNIGRRLAAGMAAAGLVEWILVGAVIGAIYKSDVARAR